MKNKIKNIEDFKTYNIICTDKYEVLYVINTLNQEKIKLEDISPEDRIVTWSDDETKYLSYPSVRIYYNDNICYKDFIKKYNKLNKEKIAEELLKNCKSIVEYMRVVPMEVIIENEIDYDNIIDYLSTQGIRWNDEDELKNLSYKKYFKTLTFFFGWCKKAEDGLMFGRTKNFSHSITVKELFKKFNIEYKTNEILETIKDFETDKNGRIIKINDFNSDKTVWYFATDKENFVMNIKIRNMYTKVLNNYISYGILFDSREAVYDYLKYISIHQQLICIANELNNEKSFDWDDCSQQKYYLYSIDGCIIQGYNSITRHFKEIYCLSENFKEKAIEVIDREDLLWYLTKSY